MFDVVFITPDHVGIVQEQPIGTLLLTTILDKNGIKAKILPFHQLGDISVFDHFLRTAIDKVFSSNPKIVSFYTRCDTYHISLKLAQALKQAHPEVYIVFGGPQSDMLAVETLSAFPAVDYICCGEGENTITPFFRSLIAKSPDLSIDGLVYRKDGEIIVNPRPALIEDLDSLPTIDYSLIDFEANSSPDSLHQWFPVDVGRGCPFGCTFCSTKTFWGRKYRLKGAKRIIEEIKEIHNRFGFTMFTFQHDMFTLNREKILEICGMLKNIGFDITWTCSARIDCLDPELIDIMVDAGMVRVFVGIETGSPRMQKLIHKNLNPEKVWDILSHVSKRKTRFIASFIYGFPDETEEDFVQTMALMLKLSKLPHSQVDAHLCAFLAGTELTTQYHDRFERANMLSSITRDVAVHDCEDLILAHPNLFPQFFEFKSELREKIKYFSTFFEYWQTVRPVYDYIYTRYYPEQLCQMLYDFSQKNRDVLTSDYTVSMLDQHDRFLDTFSNDENYILLKEVVNFLIWKERAENGSTGLFMCDIQAVLKGEPIEKIQPSLTIVKSTTTSNNIRSLSFYKR
jgi:radical SAM superfamily enzyme